LLLRREEPCRSAPAPAPRRSIEARVAASKMFCEWPEKLSGLTWTLTPRQTHVHTLVAQRRALVVGASADLLSNGLALRARGVSMHVQGSWLLGRSK